MHCITLTNFLFHVHFINKPINQNYLESINMITYDNGRPSQLISLDIVQFLFSCTRIFHTLVSIVVLDSIITDCIYSNNHVR